MDHTSDAPSPHAQILGITGKILPARCIAVAAELGIADHLATGPQTPSELANACSVHAPSLYRMLRYLASIGIFEEDDAGAFHNTPASETFREGVTGSLRSMVRQSWQDVVWDTYKALPENITTGTPAFTLAHGEPFFSFLANNPDKGALFDESMALMSGAENAVIANTYPFEGAATVVDIGGGRGGLLAEVLKMHQNTRGVLFDQAQVLEEPEHLKSANVLEQCELVSGDFFKSIPTGGDVYMLKRILHDWSDADAITILKNIRAAMSPDSRVAVIDAVIKPGNDPDPNKYLDMGIMTLLEGRERTAEEFEELFQAAGLKLRRILPTPAPSTMSIVEGKLAEQTQSTAG